VTDAEPASRSRAADPAPVVDPGLAEGRSRLLLYAGMATLFAGWLADAGVVAWGGTLLFGLAFVLNTAGKLSHYAALPIPGRHRLLLSASWVLLALAVVGLLIRFVHVRYGAGTGAVPAWLAIAGVGFGLLHMAAQSKFLPGGDGREE